MTQLGNFGARFIDYRTAWRAALFLGVVVWAINWPHGPLRALPAALLVATAIPTAIGFTFLLHSLKGTPEPVQSTLPTILLSPSSFAVWGWRSRAGREAVAPALQNNEPGD